MSPQFNTGTEERLRLSFTPLKPSRSFISALSVVLVPDAVDRIGSSFNSALLEGTGSIPAGTRWIAVSRRLLINPEST